MPPDELGPCEKAFARVSRETGRDFGTDIQILEKAEGTLGLKVWRSAFAAGRKQGREEMLVSARAIAEESERNMTANWCCGQAHRSAAAEIADRIDDLPTSGDDHADAT
jgi:hypothetical protein